VAPALCEQAGPEDRCHLNGLALVDGEARYFTAVSTSDVADGWARPAARWGRCHRPDDRASPGLRPVDAAPPRFYRERLWLLEAGTGYLGSVAPEGGKFERLTFCPGYLRGLSFVGDYAVVGLSEPRHEKTFAGLALQDELAAKGGGPRCGLCVIDLRSGDIVEWVRLGGTVRELYDVVVLPGVVRPMAFGFKTDEVQRIVTMGEAEIR